MPLSTSSCFQLHHRVDSAEITCWCHFSIPGGTQPSLRGGGNLGFSVLGLREPASPSEKLNDEGGDHNKGTGCSIIESKNKSGEGGLKGEGAKLGARVKEGRVQREGRVMWEEVREKMLHVHHDPRVLKSTWQLLFLQSVARCCSDTYHGT